MDLLGGLEVTGVDGGVTKDGDPGVAGGATGCGGLGVGVCGSGTLTIGSGTLTTGSGLLITGAGFWGKLTCGSGSATGR